ncbi:flagellar biosynthesis protein FlgA [Micromonospora sp. STR1_7]|uniref:Flagellar biosynthesis protein FlgA n=1 Tax=Micromonospora parastrephiae TaxID=2806101 RepID=A0ABS1Y078_9ACTN|nr:flagellar biosynthesis protein FlgA [Micromonospora parastrephiae]MBM0234920.1 flagellar biosynthesis protein FlgA [Micromonospora parastrephiae]
MGDPDSARALRPLRRLTLPGRPTLLRAALVAVLLGLAAAVLDTPTGCPGATHAVPSPAGPTGPDTRVDGHAASESSTAGPAGTGSTDGSGRDGRPPTDAGGRVGPLPLPSGSVGVPVRLAEPAALAVVRPGARVDLLAAPPGGTGTEVALLAAGALVLDVLGGGATDGSSALYLALRPDQAQRAVGLPEGSRFAIVIRG